MNLRYLLLLLSAVMAMNAAELTVDFSKTNGVIRPLHGVNLGPLSPAQCRVHAGAKKPNF
jgi:hypothetical protein